MKQLSYMELPVDDFRRRLPELRELYRAAFAEPPYQANIAEYTKAFEESATRNVEQPGFACWSAWADDEVVGFVYGYKVPPSWWFHRSIGSAPTAIKTAEKLFVVEWAVHPANRRCGVGRALLRKLMANREEPWAVLVTHPDSLAKLIYERAGWQWVGTTRPQGIWPLMAIMAIDLTSRVR